MLILNIILFVAALVLIWWLSCSLTKAVFFGQPDKPGKLKLLNPLDELLSEGGHPKHLISICSSLDNVQAKLNKEVGTWVRVVVDMDVIKKYVFQDGKKISLYTIEWRHNTLEDIGFMNEVLSELEDIILENYSVGIIVDAVPTFHLSRAIDCSEKNASEMSVLSRLADVLSRFEISRFKEEAGQKNDKGDEGQNPAVKQVRFARNWLASTPDERVQLYALARGGFANQKRIAALSSLLNRGLLQVKDLKAGEDDEHEGEGKANKMVALQDPEFGNYIRDNLDHDELRAWQREGHGNIWRKIWPPLTIVAVLALLFFLNANPEALGILLALLGATVGAAPVAISLARSWRSSGQSDSAD